MPLRMLRDCAKLFGDFTLEQMCALGCHERCLSKAFLHAHHQRWEVAKAQFGEYTLGLDNRSRRYTTESPMFSEKATP